MQAWSPVSGSYGFGPFGPSLSALLPGARFRRVLDLGCGDGANTQRLSAVAEEVWGVDADEQQIHRAQTKYPAVRFQAGTAEEFLNSTPLTFDGVVCARLLGFIPDLYTLFKPLMARTNGYFILSDWHPMACWVTPDGLVGMDYSAEGRFAPGQYHHSLSSITNALLDCGFTICRVIEGPARRADAAYSDAPPAVQGLPLTMTWICKIANQST